MMLSLSSLYLEERSMWRRIVFLLTLRMLPVEYRIIEWLLLLALVLNRLHDAIMVW